jgi:hypothetical protein
MIRDTQTEGQISVNQCRKEVSLNTVLSLTCVFTMIVTRNAVQVGHRVHLWRSAVVAYPLRDLPPRRPVIHTDGVLVVRRHGGQQSPAPPL